MKQRVVITGSSRGIGAELARIYARSGAFLALIALPEPQQTFSDELRNLGASDVLLFDADVSDAEKMTQIGQTILEKWNQEIDVVIANAGVGGLNPAYAFDAELNRKFHAINFLGQANTFAPFVQAMLHRRSGTFAGVSSLAAFRGLPQACSYSSSKAAQRIFLESWRVDLKPYGIRVCSIHPGFVKTAMTEHDDFDMPFMVPVEKAAQHIHRAITQGKSHDLFPWPMRILTFFNRMLPDRWYDWVILKAARPQPHARARTF